MSKYCSIHQGGKLKVDKVKYCDSNFSKALGLMFRLKPVGALLVNSKESILGTSIHMLFVFFPLNIYWLDSNFNIVDYKKVKPFTLNHKPKKKAKYVLELPVNKKLNKNKITYIQLLELQY
jgi:uncharacterized protein